MIPFRAKTAFGVPDCPGTHAKTRMFGLLQTVSLDGTGGSIRHRTNCIDAAMFAAWYQTIIRASPKVRFDVIPTWCRVGMRFRFKRPLLLGSVDLPQVVDASIKRRWCVKICCISN